MRRLNALFVLHGATLGGAERVVLELLEGLDRSRFRPYVVIPEAGLLMDRLRRMNIDSFVQPAPWWVPFEHESAAGYHFRRYWENVPAFVDPLVRLITELQIDVVYSASTPILHAALAAHVARRPHVQHMQDLLGWPHLGTKMPFGSAPFAYRLIGAFASVVVCVGQTIREDIGHAIPAQKCRIVPLGFEDGNTVSRGPSSGTTTKGVRVGIVGTVDRRKGADVIGAIIRRVCAQAPNVRFFWAGAGDPHVIDRVTAAAEINGVTHLQCLGFTDRVSEFMASLDILLHPARNETFPRVLLEAAMARLPVVVTRCGGASEIVQDGVTGLLAPIDDVEALSEAVLQLVHAPGRRIEMGVAARRVAEQFDMASFRRGMAQALADAEAYGPAIRRPATARAVTALIYGPSRVARPLRRWGVNRWWHAMRPRARENSSA